jgi:pimeloyl-ACP methyl ester carboxylesterase
VSAPVLWVAAADSHIPRWLAAHPEGEGAVDNLSGVRRRMAELADARLLVVPDAGHMLHHDQPAAVAAAIEAFLPR